MADANNKAPEPNRGWWASCKAGIKKTWEHARTHMHGSANLVGKLYYCSLAVGWASAAAAYNGVAGAGQVSLTAFIVARALKVTWDHVRDLQDVTDDSAENMETTEERIARLEKLVDDQNEVIQGQLERNDDLSARLEEVNTAQQGYNRDNVNLSQALDALKIVIANKNGVDPGDVEETIEDIKRMLAPPNPEALREKYQNELETAKATGSIVEVAFDSDKDELIRFSDDDDDDYLRPHS